MRTPASTMAWDTLFSTMTFTEAAMLTDSASEVLAAQLLKNASFAPKVPVRYLVIASGPSERILSTSSPHDSGMYSSGRVRNG